MNISRSVLVLNQNYEPLTVCRARRAVVLLFLGKAELVESYNHQVLHSARLEMPLPSVLRLNHFVRIVRKEIPLTKRNILKRDRYQCQYCGRVLRAMTTDHVLPRDLGGTDTWENLVCACPECNSRKGNRTLQAAGLRLRRPIRTPHYFTFVLANLGRTPPEWRPYLFLD